MPLSIKMEPFGHLYFYQNHAPPIFDSKFLLMISTSSKIFCFFCICFSAILYCQTTISGKVSSKNRGIKDVNITLQNTYDGATSDANGNFTFTTTETGMHRLTFTHPDYREINKEINISGSSMVVNIEMKDDVTEINALVITAGRMEVSDRNRSSAVLSPLDIYTTAGTDAQTSTGYKFLPGVQNAGESEGLFVRGGTGAETKFFIDGNLVNHYFTSSVPGLPGRERFNTSIFKGSVFSTGGYSALYGQALSSVLLLESVDMPEQSSYSFSIFPFSLEGNYQSLNPTKTTSFGVEANISDLSLATHLLPFHTDFIQSPRSISVNGNFRIKTKSDGLLKYYGSFDTNSLAISQQSLEPNYDKEEPKIKGDNTFHSLNFKQNFGKYKLEAGASFSKNINHLAIGIVNDGNTIGIINIDNKGTYFNNKVVLETKIAKASQLKVGYELLSEVDKNTFSFFENPSSHTDINNFTTAFFAEGIFAFHRNFSASVGLRAENSSFLHRWNLAPRLAAAYRLSRYWTTSLAYGIFYQTPETQYLTKDFSQPFTKASHYIFQITRNENGRSLRFEAFYKKYNALVKTSTSLYQPKTQDSYGNGYAQGFEFFWRDKKSLRNIDYWVSYSYLDSKREFLNYPSLLSPDFAATHNLSVVAKKFVENWKTGFNFSYTFTSGRPYYDIISENGINKLLKKGRVKNYNALNFSVNYLPNIGKKDAKSFTIFVAGISNILGTKNIYGYRFSMDGLRSAPILPSSPRFVYVGALFSFGIDKTQEAIDNNL